MQPTLNDHGDVVLTECISPRLGRLRVGDIVVVTKPTDGRVSILKRIRASGGDKVTISGRPGEMKEIVVPQNHVWLQGDNDGQSTDSRHYGAVPEALVRGKVWARVWPPKQMKWLGGSRAHGGSLNDAGTRDV